MQIAARNGSIPMLELLSVNGGSISTKGHKGDTLFQLAASNGHLSVVKWLDQSGLVDISDSAGNTAVHVAARRVEVEILRYFDVNMGCKFCVTNLDGQTPFDCIPRLGDDLERITKCRELVKNILAEASRQQHEGELAIVNRRASVAH